MVIVYDPHTHSRRPFESFERHGLQGRVATLLSPSGRLFNVHMDTGTSTALETSVDLGVQIEADDHWPGTETVDTASTIPEGLSDPNILKAIFLIGSGGSGKGTVSNAMFGGLGFKIINPDKNLERFMKLANIPLKDVGMHYSLFTKAREQKNAELRQYALRRLGIIVDTTGWEYERISIPVRKLRSLGYDCYCVFVSTSLETALSRNHKRAQAGGRLVPDSFVQTAFEGALLNSMKYKRLFGKGKFFVIDNDEDIDPEDWRAVIMPKLRSLANKILSKPIANRKGLEWLIKQMNPTTNTIDTPGAGEKEWPKGDTDLSSMKQKFQWNLGDLR